MGQVSHSPRCRRRRNAPLRFRSNPSRFRVLARSVRVAGRSGCRMNENGAAFPVVLLTTSLFVHHYLQPPPYLRTITESSVLFASSKQDGRSPQYILRLQEHVAVGEGGIPPGTEDEDARTDGSEGRRVQRPVWQSCRPNRAANIEQVPPRPFRTGKAVLYREWGRRGKTLLCCLAPFTTCLLCRPIPRRHLNSRHNQEPPHPGARNPMLMKMQWNGRKLHRP